MVLPTLRVAPPLLSLSGNSLTDTSRCLSSLQFWTPSSWPSRAMLTGGELGTLVPALTELHFKVDFFYWAIILQVCTRNNWGRFWRWKQRKTHQRSLPSGLPKPWRDEHFTSASFSSVLCREPESHSSLLSKGDRQGYRMKLGKSNISLTPWPDWNAPKSTCNGFSNWNLSCWDPVVSGWPLHNLLVSHSKPMEKTLIGKSVPTPHSHS